MTVSLPLGLATQAQPDVMLVDLGLPGVDGCEFCQRVRAAGNRDALRGLGGRSRNYVPIR